MRTFSILKSAMITTALLSAVASPLAWAGDLGDAVSAHRYDEYAKAFPIFEKLAEAGDARAQFYLGHMYQRGEGVKRSKKKAKKWIMLAAENGDDHARTQLGYMYLYGYGGVKKSEEKSYDLLKLASENGHPVGRYYLAEHYRWGGYVEQNEQMAFNLFSQVTRMDSFSEHLWGMDRWDPIKTVKKMADNGAKETFTEEQAAKLKAEEERKAQWLAEHNAKKAATEAAAAAQLKAKLDAAGPLENGLYAFQAGDYTSAFPKILAHAENGNALAQTYTGIMYRDGKGTPRDNNLAAQWFLKSGENGYGPAYYHHADMAYSGLINFNSKWTNFQAEGWKSMEKAARLNYQPAKDFIQAFYDKKEAEAAESDRLRQVRLQKEAEAEAARAEHRRLYGRKSIDYGKYRCRNPRKMLVSRNNGLAREETVCD